MSPVTPGASTTTSPPRPRDAAPARPVAQGATPGTDASGADDAPADGRSTRWADHREARRAELVRVARRTVHHQGPDVSMEEIAVAAGTSKSIVYRYFTDKTGLQVAVAQAVVLQIQEALEDVLRLASTPREASRAMVAVYLEMIESSPHVYAFVTRDGSVESGGPLGHFIDAVTALVAAPFARALTEARDDGRAGPGGPDAGAAALADAWAAGAVGFVRGAGEWWLVHRGEAGAPDREALTAQVAAWLWAGPVGLLARDHPRGASSAAPAGTPVAPPPATSPSSTPTPVASAHPADRPPTGGDEAARTPREQP